MRCREVVQKSNNFLSLSIGYQSCYFAFIFGWFAVAKVQWKSVIKRSTTSHEYSLKNSWTQFNNISLNLSIINSRIRSLLEMHVLYFPSDLYFVHVSHCLRATNCQEGIWTKCFLLYWPLWLSGNEPMSQLSYIFSLQNHRACTNS